ncbi:MAG: hypothetical protein AAB520_01410 [Patescibacteria group bacterium]
MSNKLQTSKNIQLTNSLLSFLMHGKNIPNLPEDVSFIPFSQKDTKLNKANEELLGILTKEEKPVVIAEEPKKASGSWIITPVNF